ncbi:uncharacterized protein [Primulina huaijiensis]|uniref:uncharacterized protein n=1 Tax=Primulina huaijiensis TaxID=1492673 RepID=UPI003CC76DAE
MTKLFNTPLLLSHSPFSFLICLFSSFLVTMPAEHCRKSGQIPAFGDWENAGELPITQYFECARQAGLLRCSCSGECPAGYVNNNINNAGFWGGGAGGGADLYASGFERPPPRRVGFEKPPPRRIYSAPQQKARRFDKGCLNEKEQRKQVQVRYLMHHPRNHQRYYPKQSNKPAYVVSQQQTSTFTGKPVDEDLYKIPSEHLDNSKGKKVLGFFRRCMVPPCAA